MEDNANVNGEQGATQPAAELKPAESDAGVNTQLGIPEDNIIDNVDDLNAGFEYEPLFESEAISEEALKGEDVTGDEAANPEPKDEKAKEGADGEGKPKEDAAKDEGANTKKGTEEVVQKLNEKEAQISGLNTALHKERQTVRQLREQLQYIADENSKLKNTGDAEGAKFKDFKVLSDEEYEDLLVEDLEEANKYLHKLTKYTAYKSQEEKVAQNLQRNQEARQDFIEQGLRSLEQVIPGITSGSKPTIVNDLIAFSVDHGIAEDVLGVITDPKSSIVTPSGESYLLGPEAANITNFIKSVYDAVSSADVTKLRADIEAELRPQIEAEIQKTLIEKFKQNPSGDFRSLDTAPGAGNKEVKARAVIITESEFAKLSPQEQEAYLAGT